MIPHHQQTTKPPLSALSPILFSTQVVGGTHIRSTRPGHRRGSLSIPLSYLAFLNRSIVLILFETLRIIFTDLEGFRPFHVQQRPHHGLIYRIQSSVLLLRFPSLLVSLPYPTLVSLDTSWCVGLLSRQRQLFIMRATQANPVLSSLLVFSSVGYPSSFEIRDTGLIR
jgi:hypothetical protein